MKLYHYTSVETLKKMLSSSICADDESSLQFLNFYATHIKFLDDKQEFILYTNKLKEYVTKYALEQKQHILSDIEIETLNKLCYPNFYTTSLTDSCENSYMWREYGNNNLGVCIEFDFDKSPVTYLRNDGQIGMGTAFYSLLKECKYLEPNDITFSKEQLLNIFNYITSITNTSSGNLNNVIKGANIISEIANNAIIIKHYSFSQEKEFRYIKCGNLLLEDITEEAKNTHLDFPIPLSVISSIILGSSIIDQSVIDDVTKIVKEKLDDSVTIVQVRS